MFFLLLKEHKKSKGYKQQQLKYIIFGSLISWLGPQGLFLVTFGTNIYPYSNFLIILYSPVFAYAILRHQLLDIEVIIKKTLIFAGLFTAAYAIFAFFALLGQVFFERFITQNRWVSIVPSVLMVTIMLRPLENFLITVTDKYLFQKKYDYRELLKTFMSEVLTVMELGNLIKLTEQKLVEIMKLDYCRMVIGNHTDIKIEAPLKLPISIHDRAIGTLLLGKKKSDEEYTQDDVLILQSLSNALAIAISNANLVNEISNAQAKMAEKEKMATLGTLAAGMAHEIRNPVTTIKVFSEYVPDRLKNVRFLDKYRSTVTKEVDRIDHIIQTLIDFSGEDSVAEVENVDIEETINELIALIGADKGIEGEIRVAREAAGKIKVIKEIPKGIAEIKVNRKELDEILLNLTENAIHAIGDNGQITFKAEEKDRFVELSIIDTGCGMSEETIEHIFNPFFTTRSKGFGLGLFVVRQLVNRNGGIIEVESELGRGTRFRLKFKKGIS